MSYPKVELFVNIMWPELDLAICNVRKEQAPAPTRRSYSLFDDGATDSRPAPVHPKKKAALEAILNIVFDGDRWRSISAESADDRADECATLFKQMTGATWGTHLRMMDNGRIRYFLLHLTKHDDGRRLMKTCMWKASPSGGFVASKSDNPHQQLLIEREPDLEPLQEWVTRQLRMRPMRWKELSDHLVEELWLDTHLNSVLKEMKLTGELISEGKFAKTQNPLLRLAP